MPGHGAPSEQAQPSRMVFRFVGPELNDELRGRSDHLLVGRDRNVSVYEQLRRR